MPMSCISWISPLPAPAPSATCGWHPHAESWATIKCGFVALQVSGAASADGPWLKAITERVMSVYCERLSGYAWSSQV